ncbi:hypothetical protein M011DRAFT_482518 [Sporormia fimetaria CBS 119925]|uniref:C2H2-type domain-containing protein n=1 Tax=Sporormia fimetaria CBS 119925 TaxID=1340428 RepID=A0A6A6VM63_9PLEO|nr:hypothetical protein M011DRAFT_482518 [Sporormia fimetaria CBS 119925]
MPPKRKDLEEHTKGSVKRFRQGLQDEHHGLSNDNLDDAQPIVEPLTKAPTDARWSVVPNETLDGRRVWQCSHPGCEFRSNREQKMENHFRVHTKERPFACDREGCDKAFARKDHLTRHIKSTHGEGTPRPYACTWKGCTKRLATKQHLEVHVESHKKLFYCTYPSCQESFRKQTTLDAHVADMHLNADPYPCTFIDDDGLRCSRSYQNAWSLRLHVKAAHEKMAVYVCSLCPPLGSDAGTVGDKGAKMVEESGSLAFDTLKELQAHNREFHPYLCPECNKPFKSIGTFESHFLAAHADPELQKQLPCPYPSCGSAFKKRGNLNAHIRIVHEEQTPYVCIANAFTDSKKPDLQSWSGQDACGAAYKSKSSLEQHVRREHLRGLNRKEARKLARVQARSQPEANLMPPPAGVSLAGRNVPCLQSSCHARFFLDRDLRRHMISVHMWADADIEGAIKQRNVDVDPELYKPDSQAKAQPSALRLLTGVGYDGGRDVACLHTGCSSSFFNDRDLRRHLRAVHEWEDQEITDGILERNALHGGEFWVRRGQDFTVASEETSVAQTPDPYFGATLSQGYMCGFDQSTLDPILEKPFDQLKLSAAVEEDEADMDRMMGLESLQAWNMEHGLPQA